MMPEINESDWKTLRQLHSEALERFCKQVLLEIERTNSDGAKSFHRNTRISTRPCNGAIRRLLKPSMTFADQLH